MDTNEGRKVLTQKSDGTWGVFQTCRTQETATKVADSLRRKIAMAKSKPQKPGSTLAQYAAIVAVDVR